MSSFLRSVAMLSASVVLACTTRVATTGATPQTVVTTTPAPAPLTETAARFGFVALGDGWSWKELDAQATRFDWSGRPASGDREVLLSFWMPTIDAAAARFLPALVQSAAANLTEDNRPCEPFDQPKDIVDVLRVERVITVCFQPSRVYGKGFTAGVLHGVVNKGTLTIVAVLSNGHAGLIPLPDAIGLRAR